MAYKRNMRKKPSSRSRQKTLKCRPVVCHYCIVGCGYKAITWPIDQQGGTGPDQNVFGIDLSKTARCPIARHWLSPCSDVQRREAEWTRRSHGHNTEYRCKVNSGLASIRGLPDRRDVVLTASADTQEQRSNPLRGVIRGCTPTWWDNGDRPRGRSRRRRLMTSGRAGCLSRLSITEVPAAAMRTPGRTGKLYFESMKMKNIRIHNRPAYNSEVHAHTRYGRRAS